MTDYYVEREYAYVAALNLPKAELDKINKYGEESKFIFESDLPTENTPQVNLITSKVKGKKSHAPVIDLDVPCELVPSSQLGHYHLYIHKEIQWAEYYDILKAFALASLVEPGYLEASAARYASAVRLIGDKKPGVNVKVADVLSQNAKLKHENYMLTKELVALKLRATNDYIASIPAFNGSTNDMFPLVDPTMSQRDAYISELKIKLMDQYNGLYKAAHTFDYELF